MRSLRQTFDPKANGLNAVRLLLAVSVIVYHSFPLTGHSVTWGPAFRIAEDFGVDGFFAISGYLITSSWLRRPQPGAYLRARALRILPGFWVCLIATAAIFVPVNALISRTSLPAGWVSGGLFYILKNSALWMFQWDIAGTPQTVPYRAVWDGSLWTLAWEALCYLGVLALGLMGLLKFRATIPTIAILAWAVSAAGTAGLIHSGSVRFAGRFALMFFVGAMVLQYARRLPVHPALSAASLLIALTCGLLPNYRLVAAPFVAYAVITAGALLKARVFRLEQDLSYGMYIYGLPVQQLLAAAGVLAVPAMMLFGVLATLPVAALSWFGVERTFLRLKRPSRVDVVTLGAESINESGS